LPVASPRSLHESALIHDHLGAFGAAPVAVLDILRRPHRRKGSHFRVEVMRVPSAT
jgi:hypothetical protein